LTGQLFFDSPPVAADGFVYINGLEDGGTTYAVDETDGNVAWSAGTFDGSMGAVAVSNGVVYESEACSNTTAWNGSSGAVVWRYMGSCTGGGGAVPVAYGGRLYVRDPAEGDTIIDVSSGKVVGSFTTNLPPAFSNDLGYFLQSNTLRAITTDGTSTVKWSFTGDGNLNTAPVISGAYAYVGSSSGALYAVDGSGTQVWSTNVGGAINSAIETDSMTVASGLLLVPVGNNLIAYH
jgi:outer membrane protein assembly factor BamB